MTVFSYNLLELKSPLFLTSFTQFLLFALTSRLAQMIELKKNNIFLKKLISWHITGRKQREKICVNQHQVFVLKNTNARTYNTKLLLLHTFWKPLFCFKLFEILIFIFQFLCETNVGRIMRRERDACEYDRQISFCSRNKLIRFRSTIWITVHFLFSSTENIFNKTNICYPQHLKSLKIYPGFMSTERTKLRGERNVYR